MGTNITRKATNSLRNTTELHPESLLRPVELAVVLEAAEVLLQEVGAGAQRDDDPADDGRQAAAQVQRLPALDRHGKKHLVIIK